MERVDGPHELTPAGAETPRFWATYACRRCAGCVLAEAEAVLGRNGEWSKTVEYGPGEVVATYPSEAQLDPVVPEQARRFLRQALQAVHLPDAAVMVAASALDAMLKARGLSAGTLNQRIDRAAADGIITGDVAKWAHQVRLDANDPRHADINAPPHDAASAKRVVDFAMALADILFVIPSRVTRGIGASAPGAPAPKAPP
jgi:hypothetical protein